MNYFDPSADMEMIAREIRFTNAPVRRSMLPLRPNPHSGSAQIALHYEAQHRPLGAVISDFIGMLSGGTRHTAH